MNSLSEIKSKMKYLSTLLTGKKRELETEKEKYQRQQEELKLINELEEKLHEFSDEDEVLEIQSSSSFLGETTPVSSSSTTATASSSSSSTTATSKSSSATESS